MTKEKKLDEEVKEEVKKEQKKQDYNKLFKSFILGGIVFIAVIVAIVFFLSSIGSFTYRGVDFETVKEGNLIFYKTKFPVVINETRADYNIYLRNDPRKLDREVPFTGSLNLKQMMVLNSTSDFGCDGDGLIAIGNFLKLQIFNIEIIKDVNATCSKNGEYAYVNLKEGNKTKIEQVGPSCYTIEVANCEILKGTERFMDEAFVKVKELM